MATSGTVSHLRWDATWGHKPNFTKVSWDDRGIRPPDGARSTSALSRRSAILRPSASLSYKGGGRLRPIARRRDHALENRLLWGAPPSSQSVYGLCRRVTICAAFGNLSLLDLGGLPTRGRRERVRRRRCSRHPPRLSPVQDTRPENVGLAKAVVSENVGQLIRERHRAGIAVFRTDSGRAEKCRGSLDGRTTP